MFNNIYNSTKVVFNNFSAFSGAVVRPVAEGAVITIATVVAKSAIHAARFVHDAAIDIFKIGYNVFITGYKFATTVEYDWAAGNWHASDKVKIIIKPSNSSSETRESQDESQFSAFMNFVSKTWNAKDDSYLGKAAEGLSGDTVVAKLVVDVFCLVGSVLLDGVILTVYESLKAGAKGDTAAEGHQKDVESQQQVNDGSFAHQVKDILGLNDPAESAESADFTADEIGSMGEHPDVPDTFE